MEVPWQDGGINPETKEHAQYLDNLCDKYTSVVKETVNKLIEHKTKEPENQLVEAKNCGEKIQHKIRTRFEGDKKRVVSKDGNWCKSFPVILVANPGREHRLW